MLSRLAVEAITARATGISLEVLEVRRLPGRAGAMRPNLPATFRAAHATATRHGDCQIDVNQLPRTVRPELAV